MLAAWLVIGLTSSLFFPAPALAQNTEAVAGVQGSKNIRSLKEIRGEDVVRQKWDVSCGAAALSTVLTYDFKDPTPETAIVVWILHRVDGKRVRDRGDITLRASAEWRSKTSRLKRPRSLRRYGRRVSITLWS
jgi:uncharacterized protein